MYLNLYDIFISYHREDGAEFAEGLANALRTQGYKVFFDKNSLDHGVTFPKMIRDAIQNAREFICIITNSYLGPDAQGRRRIEAGNDWVRKELAAALKTHTLTMLPIIVGCQPPDRTQLPRGLKRLASINCIRYDRSFDTYVKITDRLKEHFSEQTNENALVGRISSELNQVDINDYLQFNIACKEIIHHLTDKHGERALLHILSHTKSEDQYFYPTDYRYIVFYTVFSYYRRMHMALQLIELVETYAQEFSHLAFTHYVYVEYHLTKFKLSIDRENEVYHISQALLFSKKAVAALPDNNGIIHSFCLCICYATENHVAIGLEDYHEALSSIRIIIERDLSYALYHCTLARLLAHNGNYKEALVQLRIAQTLEQPSHDDWILRISNYRKFETAILCRMYASGQEKP